MNKQVRTDLMLVAVAFCWGISYSLVDFSLREVGPLMINAYRFLGAFLAASLLSWKSIRKVNIVTLKYCLILGLIQVVTFIGATYGIKYTTLSNSGFLCTLAVVIVPIIELIIFKKKPEKKVTIAVFFCLIGIMLLTLKDDFSINRDTLGGDLFCLLCSLAYACNIIVTDHAVSKPDVDALHLGIFQLFVTGTAMLLLAFIFETPAVPSSGSILAVIICIAVVTGVPCVLQTVAQQYADPSHVGIIFTMEPVFAAIAAFFYGGEILTPKAYLGIVIMLLAMLMTVIDFGKKK